MRGYKYLEKWELWCIVLNCVVHKILNGYTAVFSKYGGSAAWLGAFIHGVIFLAVLKLVLRICEPYADEGLLKTLNRKSSVLGGAVGTAAVIGFALTGFEAVLSTARLLKEITYVQSPMWFVGGFLALGGVLTAVLGSRAVFRIHSLTALGSLVTIILILILNLKRFNWYNIFPILGRGAEGAILGGFRSLYMYLDILLIFFIPRKEGEYDYKKTVFSAAAVGTATTVVMVLAITLSLGAGGEIKAPLYAMAMGSDVGKLSLRLDAAYQGALIVSNTVYVALAANVVIRSFKRVSKGIKNIIKGAMCGVLCLFLLCGCYDGSEVEENAYAIALGVDVSDNDMYRYTFQVSNPLKSGKVKDGETEASAEGNETVDNIVIEAADYYRAEDKLKSVLSKDLSLSHLKLLVFSFEAAQKGAPSQGSFMLYGRELRPETNMCLAPSARDFLLNIKPSLEESTVRFYELFFKNANLPYAPVSTVREFTQMTAESGGDAVLPIVEDGSLEGMGVFSNEMLCMTANYREVMLYKLVKGELKGASLGEGSGTVSNVGGVKIGIDKDLLKADIEIKIKTKEGQPSNISRLEAETEEFLNSVYQNGCDILGLGMRLKKDFLTEKEWEAYNWRERIKSVKFKIGIISQT